MKSIFTKIYKNFARNIKIQKNSNQNIQQNLESIVKEKTQQQFSQIQQKQTTIIQEETIKQKETIKQEERIKQDETIRKPKKQKINQINIDLNEKHSQTHRMDPLDPSIDEEFLSQLHLDIQHLPLNILKKCHKVFSKYPSQMVTKLGKEYMKLYQTLHATEKPLDNTQIKPFENTENLGEQTKDDNFIYLGSQKKLEQIEETGIQKDKEKKLQIEDKSTEKQDKEHKRNQTFYNTQLVYTQNMSVAYLLKKLPGTFAVACRVFAEIKYRTPEFKPVTFLDFGAGLGSGSIAFQDLFDNTQITACEPATPMKKLGSFLTDEIDNIKVKIVNQWVSTLSETLNPSQFDIVYFGYILEELVSSEERKMVIEALYTKTKPNGYMIMVEPGSPKGFRFINDFRNWAISKNLSIIAPCPHRNQCPLAKERSWCNFDQTVGSYPKNIFPVQTKPYYKEKFSYMVIKKGQFEQDDSLQHKTFDWARIVRPIMKRNKHIIVDICNQDGDLERVVGAKSYTEYNYKEMKHLKNGDLWRFPKRVPNKFRKETKFGKKLW